MPFVSLECKREATWRKLCSGRSSTVTQPNSSYLNRSCDEKGQSIDSLRGKLAFLLLVWSTELLLNRVEREREKRAPAPPGNYIKLKGRCVLSYSSSIQLRQRPWTIANKKGLWSSSLRSGHSRRLQSLNDTGENRIPLTERDWPTDGRFNTPRIRGIAAILMTRWNLMISMWAERAYIRGAQIPVALIKETARRTDWNR